MVKAVVPEVRAYTTICRQSLVLQFVVINELRIRSGRFLHRLRVLTLLRHLVGLHNHLVIAPAVEVARTLREVR